MININLMVLRTPISTPGLRNTANEVLDLLRLKTPTQLLKVQQTMSANSHSNYIGELHRVLFSLQPKER